MSYDPKCAALVRQFLEDEDWTKNLSTAEFEKLVASGAQEVQDAIETFLDDERPEEGDGVEDEDDEGGDIPGTGEDTD